MHNNKFFKHEQTAEQIQTQMPFEGAVVMARMRAQSRAARQGQFSNISPFQVFPVIRKQNGLRYALRWLARAFLGKLRAHFHRVAHGD